ncbi:hypothetical protein N9R81_00425 [Flavobacteriales bacterium]|nr:hypothetical protein [Flavobacteriales bacterium]
MQTLGIFLFFCVIGMAFWMLIFLASFLPYVATLLILDKVNPQLAEKLAIWK